VTILRPLLFPLTCLVALVATAAPATAAPPDVMRIERAVLALHDDKADAAGEKAKGQKAARNALAPCDERGPGWERIRAVRDRSQRGLYVRGARTLWRDLAAAAADRAALTAYQPSFDRFLARFDEPLDDGVLRAGVEAIRSRLAYEAQASASASCKTFERLTKAVREFKPGVSADIDSGQIYQRMIHFLPKQRAAATRKHWNGARIAAADAARARLAELGGDVGRATYFRFAYSLEG
jgi:hypothetical protein